MLVACRFAEYWSVNSSNTLKRNFNEKDKQFSYDILQEK